MSVPSRTRRLLEAADLVQGLAVHEVESRLQVGLRLHDVGHRILAFYLADMETRGLHNELGFATTSFFARERLGLDRRRTRELLAAGHKLLTLPRIDRAFLEQLIGWSKVALLVKVAVPETDDAWLERALGLSVRDLAREVSRSREGQPPRKLDDQRGLSQIRLSVRARVTPLTHRKWDLAKQKLSAELGRPLDDAELLDLLAEVCLSTDADGTIEGRAPIDASNYRVVLHDRGPEAGGLLEVDTELGLLPVEESATLACDAEVDAKTSSTLRRFILDRDGRRCRCCGSRYGLHAHHVAERAHGGRTHRTNLITLCTRCHGLVHDELLVLAGPHAEAIEFRDRTGRRLHELGETVDPAELIRLKPPRRSDGSEAPAEPAPATTTLEDLPDTIDEDWWRRHAHLLSGRGGAGLEFRAGVPLPEDDRAVEPESAAAPKGVPFAEACAGLVGQDDRLRRFEVAAQGSRARGRSFPHTLFLGPAGTGKTTLAQGVAKACGRRLLRTSGPLLQDTHELIRQLAALRPHDVWFIDEIHAASPSVLEALYEALEEQQVSLTLHAGVRSRTVRFALPSFTVLAATTEEGALPAPLRNRFGLRECLDYYAEADLAAHVEAEARAQGYPATHEAAAQVARFSRGVPREAKRLLARVLDAVAGRGETSADRSAVDEVFAAMGYDANGLEPLEQRYLHLLGESPVPIPLARLAEMLGATTSTLTRFVEPFLFRKGLVQTTPRGRVAVRRPLRLVMQS